MNLIDLMTIEEKQYLIVKDYKKNQIIFNEGDECKYLAFILKGEVFISTYTLLEKEFNIKTLHEGNLFGEFLLFHVNPYYLGNIISKKETKLAFINKDNLYLIFKNNPVFFQHFMELIGMETITLQLRVKILAQTSIREKILFYLQNQIQKEKTNVLKIKTKEQLASFLNIPRPSLSRELIKLKNEGFIDYDRKTITLKYK